MGQREEIEKFQKYDKVKFWSNIFYGPKVSKNMIKLNLGLKNVSPRICKINQSPNILAPKKFIVRLEYGNTENFSKLENWQNYDKVRLIEKC